MSDDSCFRDLLRRVRGGDEAAAELVRTYEPAIRAAARVRLTDPRLRRLCDSIDICQSVLANFFVRAGSGDFELDRADQLLLDHSCGTPWDPLIVYPFWMVSTGAGFFYLVSLPPLPILVREDQVQNRWIELASCAGANDRQQQR
ncbi:MAG: hypothetical protein HY000_16010 [Planctomycetes bacterium]|nr:hypothetical protein [Planctomycetota bacterium]